MDEPRNSPPLSKEVKQKIDDGIGELVTLLRAYQTIYERAERGEKITGQDFLDAEAPLNGSNKFKQMQELQADEQALAYVRHLREKSLKENHFDPVKALGTEALNHAFVQQYIKPARYHEKITLNPSTDTEEELIDDLLSNNRGFGLLDIHSEEEGYQFLTRRMPQLKAKGVGTIYLESATMLNWAKYTQKELETMARDSREEKEDSAIKARLREAYGAKKADNITAAEATFMAAAMKNGIRLVYIDKDDNIARQLEPAEHRIASTNFVWPDKVEADHQGLVDNGQKNTKFVIVGGRRHFVLDDTYPTPGWVDEALGIPTIAFERPAGRTAAFRKSENPNDADFYLLGDAEYPRGGATIAPKEVNPAASFAKPGKESPSR